MTRYADNWTVRITATLALALAAGCAPSPEATPSVDGRHELASIGGDESFELIEDKLDTDSEDPNFVPSNDEGGTPPSEEPSQEPTTGDHKAEGAEGGEGVTEPPKTDAEEDGTAAEGAEDAAEDTGADAEPPRDDDNEDKPAHERPDENPEPAATAFTSDYCEVSASENAEAIQNCIAQVAPNQGEVHLAPGEFTIVETIELPTGVTLTGSGPSTVLSLEGRTDMPVLAVGPLAEEPATTTVDVAIRDLAIYGAAADQTSSTVPNAGWLPVSGILVRSAERVAIANVIISETAGAGVTVELGSRDVSLTDVQVYDGQFDGVAVQDTSNIRIERTILSGNAGAGLSFDWGVDGASVREAVIADNGYGWAGGDNPGIYMAMTFNSAIEKSEIIGNDGNGIVLTNQGMADSPSLTCSSNNSFHGNDISGNGQFGFWLTHGSCAGNTGNENILRQNVWGPVFEPVTGQLDQRHTVCEGNGCATLLD